ncbi:MAG: DUF302 domain-containing protein [Alphaproteobacteria bacterium]|jgi:uncharacterized protein (DUF302 family)|nr:DUF302 domain-containing protein [Alphaproteobacteria bacterium]
MTRRRTKSGLNRLIATCLLVIASITSASAIAATEQKWPYADTITIETRHDFATLVTRVQAAVKESGLFVVTRASASVGAARREISIPGNMVLGVFRNDFAVRMLDASVPAGIEAPLRFYLYENTDGTSSLTYRTPSSVFAPYNSEALSTLAAELDEMFAAIATAANR